MITLDSSSDYGLKGQYIARIKGRDDKVTFNREFIGRKSGKRNQYSTADVDEPGIYECCDVERNTGKKSRFYFISENLIKLTTDKKDAMIVARLMDEGLAFSEIVIATKADPEAVEVDNEINFLKKILIIENSPDWIAKMERPAILTRKVGVFNVGEIVEQKVLQPAIKSEIEQLKNKLTALRENNKYPTDVYEIMNKKEIGRKQKEQTLDSALIECWQILQALPENYARKVLVKLRNKLTASQKTEDKSNHEDNKN